MNFAPALLAISQGSGDQTPDRAVAELVAAVTVAAPELHVSTALIDVQQPDVLAPLSALADGESVVVVPLLLSAGYHVHSDVAAELAGNPSHPAILAPSLGPDEALVQVLASRLHEAGLAPGDVVVLAAVGSSDHRAVRDCIDTGRRLAGLLARSVTVGFISAAVPRLSSAIETQRRLHPGSRVVIASYVLSPGHFADLAAAAGGDAVAEPLLVPGRPPPRQLVDLVLERYRAAAASLATA